MARAQKNEGTPLPHPNDDWYDSITYRQFTDVEEVETYRGRYYTWSVEAFGKEAWIEHCADKETAGRFFDEEFERVSKLRTQHVYSMKLAALFLKRTSKFCVCKGDQNHFDEFIVRPMGGSPTRRDRHGRDRGLGFVSWCPYLTAITVLARVLIVVVTTLNVTRLFGQICNKVKWRAFQLVEEIKEEMRGLDRQLLWTFLDFFRAGETCYNTVCEQQVARRIGEFKKRVKIKANMIVQMANDKLGCSVKPCIHNEPCPVCKRNTRYSRCAKRCQLICKPVIPFTP